MRAVGLSLYVAGWVLVLCVVLASATRYVYGQTGHHGDGRAQHHDQYQHWRNPITGGSCCSSADCRPTRARMDDGGQWEAWDGWRWIPVPPMSVLKVPSPDGRSHLCESKGAVYCFLPGPTMH